MTIFDIAMKNVEFMVKYMQQLQCYHKLYNDHSKNSGVYGKLSEVVPAGILL